ncbi:MAG TPA: PA14 domain-containing protein, partial [Sedimentisphaerales bacterium]|nr:PA14 domain-containing protein [Sedimentisphaerales bacterium]
MRRIYLVCTVLVLGLWLPGTVADAQNQIRNWEFDEPLVIGVDGHWWMWESVNFTGLSVVQGAALSGENALQVAMPDGASGSLQVYQSFMKLEQGVTYTISFMARADAPRTITVRLQARTLYNWQTFWSQAGIELTTEPQTFTFQYEHTGATVGGTGTFDSDIDFCFDHGGSDVDAYYDHIWLGDGPPPLPVAPASANSPNPADGEIYTQTWATLGWMPGDKAVSHDVYFGESFNDVNDGTGDTFRGNQDLMFFVVGLSGYAYPDGLVPGTTYYWRIDEVNDADPNSPWKGNVWSFMIPSKKAYEPVPNDGVKFVDAENLVLSWTTGLGAILHTVYFGDDFDTVANATDGVSLGLTNFSPGPLELEKTYFWRVDELETQGMHKGDVWSFTTAKAGGGIRGDYYKGMNFDNFVLTRTDPQVDFNWGDPGGPDQAVGDDSFSARWTGEVEAAFTETYTFYTSTDDGVRLWVDGQQLVNAWVDQAPTEYRGTIDLVAGNTYSLVMEYYENSAGAVAQLRWSSPSTQKDFVPQAALSLPVKASSPTPRGGAVDVKQTTDLSWGPGDSAVSHEVYFGTDADAVANATKSSPEYKGTKALGDEIYDPGKLAWATTYYWRVDEVNNINPDSPWTGNLWSFTTGDFLIIDNFEDYDAGDNQIWYAWHDGLGFGTPGTADYFAGNGTGAAVGDETTPSYTEETIIHGGTKSMPLAYDNNKQGYSRYSETELTLTEPRDWTEEGVAELSLWFRGYPASTGSFVEGPVGTYTMTASGADIWLVNGVEADEFHFAYKMLTGAGSIIARVDSVQNTNDWAKAGVMIRETLDADSAHAFACITPVNGVASQGRPSTGGTSFNYNQTGVAAPYWVKLERSISGLFTVSHSANGSTWQPVTGATPQNIPMGANVYVGLALTSHDAALTCQAVFSNVTTT